MWSHTKGTHFLDGSPNFRLCFGSFLEGSEHGLFVFCFVWALAEGYPEGRGTLAARITLYKEHRRGPLVTPIGWRHHDSGASWRELCRVNFLSRCHSTNLSHHIIASHLQFFSMATQSLIIGVLSLSAVDMFS